MSSKANKQREQQALVVYPSDNSDYPSISPPSSTRSYKSEDEVPFVTKAYSINAGWKASKRATIINVGEQPQHSLRIFIYLVSLADIVLMVVEMWQNKWQFESLKVNPMLGPSADTLLLLGAKETGRIRQGQWWRLITPIFLHAGIFHLVSNLLFQLYVGLALEKRLGWWRVAFVYMLAGVNGNILSAAFLPSVMSVGASGALFGLFGLILAELLTSWSRFKSPCFQFIAYIVSIILSLGMGLLPYIDNFAHVGGFIAGLSAGLCIAPSNYLRMGECTLKNGFIAFIGGSGLLLLFTGEFVVFFKYPNANEWCHWCINVDCLQVLGWCNNKGV